MLAKITLKFGSHVGSLPLHLLPGPMTVFVGPNNSGKSLVLMEIEQRASGHQPQGHKIIDALELVSMTKDEARKTLQSRIEPISTQGLAAGHVQLVTVPPLGGANVTRQVHLDTAVNQLAAGETQWALGSITPLFTMRLDGRTRLALTEPRPSSDLQYQPQNTLAALFSDDVARKEIREIVSAAFGKFFAIDPTGMQTLRIRLAVRPPVDDLEEQALDHRARAFHAAATDIVFLSDGVKAFTGIVSAVLSSDYRIILVDEPEAFLHPPLARMLGRTLADVAAKRTGNVLASTHSSDFLMGAVESGRAVNVVRLTFDQGIASARLLPAVELRLLMRDPLLRSTGVLDALFHRGAIIAEADSDRSFYEEINQRLRSAGRAAATDTLFINAHGKGVLRRLVKPLRHLGIPAAVIVDLDIIKSGDVFRELLNACSVPPGVVQALGQLRGNVQARFTSASADMKAGGVAQLAGADLEELQTLIQNLATYGVFVVPVGEAESWLKNLKVPGHGNDWLIAMFEALGEDPEDPTYVKPGSNDVWGFLESVAGWLKNPNRGGM